ncbi:hypothetical protein [Rhodocyclus tenuis]|uniref:hypothetical protein n=1 Tax=Rhodocyclus tenuis TaxID=1066 RepID=UPI00190338B6|nr:hypothetical protein [Rhodocyclus tenuis]MBK1679751.1 hypothetical protein [Rhodocyclus tenuis]
MNQATQSTRPSAAELCNVTESAARAIEEFSPEQQRDFAAEMVKEAFKLYVESKGVGQSVLNEEDARDEVLEALYTAEKIILLPMICDVLVRVGFDPSRIFYGFTAGGVRFGWADGVSLLKFVGFLHEDAPSADEARMLISLGDNATQH